MLPPRQGGVLSLDRCRLVPVLGGTFHGSISCPFETRLLPHGLRALLLGSAALLAVLGGLSSAPAHAQSAAFHYRPERAPAVGTVWHFAKSNRDGSVPWHLDLFFASPTRIEVVKWAEGATDFVEVHADLDFARAMPVVLQQWNTTKAAREPRLWAFLPADAGELRLSVAGGPVLVSHYTFAPLQVWGFDLMGMAPMFPHLAAPDRPFEVTFLDPNRPGSNGAPFVVERGRFTPDGEETLDGVVCRRYRLAGPVFGDAVGTVWLGKGDGSLRRAEHALRTSTDWTDFRLVRVGEEKMDGIAWESFKLGLAEAVRRTGGAPE